MGAGAFVVAGIIGFGVAFLGWGITGGEFAPGAAAGLVAAGLVFGLTGLIDRGPERPKPPLDPLHEIADEVRRIRYWVRLAGSVVVAGVLSGLVLGIAAVEPSYGYW